MKILIIFLILFIFSIYLIYVKKYNIESFSVTWTPYIVDVYNQPGYSNYFYQNGYMYPVF
jgi:hypothetical protein